MFKELIAKTANALKKNNIPYMIIGGQAVLLYGTPRLTKDIDITLGLSTDELERVVDAIADAGLEIILEDYENFVKKTFVLPVRDKKTGLRVDLIFSFTPYERQAIDRAKDVKISNAEVKFAALEDIIIHKIFSGRPRDLEDARNILIKNPEYDATYIKKWLGEFDKSLEAKEFSKIFNDIICNLK